MSRKMKRSGRLDKQDALSSSDIVSNLAAIAVDNA